MIMTWTTSRPYKTPAGFRIRDGAGKIVASGTCQDESALQKMGAADDLLDACLTMDRASTADAFSEAMLLVRAAIRKAKGEKSWC